MTKALLVRSSCNQRKESMSRIIEAIMAHLVRAAEQPVALTYKIKLTGILILLALFQAALAGNKADPADEKALQERNEAFVAAFNKGDIKAMAASYAPTAIFSRRRFSG